MIHNKLIPLGIVVVFLGVLLIVVGSLFSAFKGKSTSGVRSAGIVFIGPIPLGWASDEQMFYTLLVIVVVFLLVWLLFFRRV